MYAIVIHELLRRFSRADARRAAGLLLVVALLFLAVAGTVHTGGGDFAGSHVGGHVGDHRSDSGGDSGGDRGGDHDRHACSVCDAVLAAAGAVLHAPAAGLHAPGTTERSEFVAPAIPRTCDETLVHAPRGPPVAA